jgi:hypothetical protein
MPFPTIEPDQHRAVEFPDWSATPDLDDAAFRSIDETVRHAAGAIDGLKDILGRLQRSVAQATEQRRNDIEIGQLFTRAQGFVERAVIEGHELAQRIVTDAEFEATRIIATAKEEAYRIVEEGRRATGLPAEAIAALHATIGEFGRTNSALVQELSTLTDALAAHRDAGQGVGTHLASDGSSQPASYGAEYQLPSERDTGQPLAEPPTGYWSRLRPAEESHHDTTGLNGVTGAGRRMR